MTIINYYNNIHSLATGLSLAALLSLNNEKLPLLSPYEYSLKISNNNFNYKVNAYKNKNEILSANYKICRDNIKIDYLYINNDYYGKKFSSLIILNDEEYKLLKIAFFNYIETIAYKNGKRIIIIDIHKNMERYEYELKEVGFINTDRISYNHFWYEAEKILKND